jgi:hypothetical protein
MQLPTQLCSKPNFTGRLVPVLPDSAVEVIPGIASGKDGSVTGSTVADIQVCHLKPRNAFAATISCKGDIEGDAQDCFVSKKLSQARCCKDLEISAAIVLYVVTLTNLLAISLQWFPLYPSPSVTFLGVQHIAQSRQNVFQTLKASLEPAT